VTARLAAHAVGLHDHGCGVPAGVSQNALFQLGIARMLGLQCGRNGIDVGGGSAVGQVNPLGASLFLYLFDQEMGAFCAFPFDNARYGIEPFPGFQGVLIAKLLVHVFMYLLVV